MKPGQYRFLFAVCALVAIYAAALGLTIRASQDDAERCGRLVENVK